MVIGAGSVGNPAALFLAQRGLKVLVLDEHASPGQGQNKAAIGGVRATHSDPANLIAVSLRGVAPSHMTPESHFQSMSGFQSILTDGELAQLLSYLRYHLGGRDEPISRKQVIRIREYLEDKGFDIPIHGHSTAEEQQEFSTEVPLLDDDSP